MTKDVKSKKTRIKVTDEQWKKVNSENRNITNEFIKQSVHLSDKTLLQYFSSLRIYFYWIYEFANDIPFYKIKSINYLKYQNWLIEQNLSSSAIRLRRSAVSSINNYVEVFYLDIYEGFRNYVTKAIKSPKLEYINKKYPLSINEYENLCSELERRELWQYLCYVRFSFSSGCRREEARQVLKEVVDYEPKIKTIDVIDESGISKEHISKYYMSNELRCKGSSKSGNIRRLSFDELTMESIKKWLEVRGEDDCEHLFALERKEKMNQVSESTFNSWCSNSLTKIVGRRVHPHLLRSSRATSLVLESGRDIGVAQKLLGHKSSLTTETYVVRGEDSESPDEAFI